MRIDGILIFLVLAIVVGAFLDARVHQSASRGSPTQFRVNLRMKGASIHWVAFVCSVLAANISQAQESQIERGRSFARNNCAPCHAITPAGESPLPKAPPFRTLHFRYPVEELSESLAEGIKASHPMPEFQLDAAQIADLIAFLKSLEH